MTTRFWTSSSIETQASEVLESTTSLQTPVPIEKVARALGLSLEAVALSDEVSGILVIEGGKGTIGYNQHHHRVRQRFTIAHEIGHFVLHQDEHQLFIDKQYTAVFRRDQNSSGGEYRREVQANRFAAALLMPEYLIMSEIGTMDFDLGDEQALDVLAKKFEVSAHAMSIRLGHLGVFPGDE